MAKRLYRSRRSSVIAGVCGGLGEYFDIDPVLIRILAVVLFFASGIGLLAYIIGWIAIPREREGDVVVESGQPAEPSEFRKYLPGIILIIIGAVFLLERVIWWFRWKFIWPILLIVGGALLIWRATTNRTHNGGVHESVKS